MNKKPYEKPACQQSKKPYEKPTTSVLGTIGKWLLILCTVIVLVVAAPCSSLPTGPSATRVPR